MGRPKLYGMEWRVRVPDSLHGRVKIAAALAGMSRNAWLRAACEEKLARENRARKKSA